MVKHCRGHSCRKLIRQSGPFDDRSATGWTPVVRGLRGNHGVTLAADAFHAVSVKDEVKPRKQSGKRCSWPTRESQANHECLPAEFLLQGFQEYSERG
jgi:hypothetical protein